MTKGLGRGQQKDDGEREESDGFSTIHAVICAMAEKSDPLYMAGGFMEAWLYLAVPGCPAAGHMVPDGRVHMSRYQPATCCFLPPKIGKAGLLPLLPVSASGTPSLYPAQLWEVLRD